MTTQANTQTAEHSLDDQQILDYLKTNPGFFEQHSDLLSEIPLSHPSGVAISLIEHQVAELRKQNGQLKSKLLTLVQVARDNDRLNERMHSLILDLLKANSLTVLLDALNEHLRTEFNADAIAIHLTGINDSQARESGTYPLVIDDQLKTLFNDTFSTGKPLCGRLKEKQLNRLFNEQSAAISSSAVVPIGEKAQLGLLAIGSRETTRFIPGMGTLFLSHLGELVGQLLSDLDYRH